MRTLFSEQILDLCCLDRKKRTQMRSSFSAPTFSRYDMVEPDSYPNTGSSYTQGKLVQALQRNSPVSSLLKEKTPPLSPTKEKRCIRTLFCVLTLVLIILFLYACAIYFNVIPSQGKSQYYVVLDCGSTGTRVYVYEWVIDHHNVGKKLVIYLRSLPRVLPKSSSEPTGRAYQRMETEPGLHKLVYNETGLKNVILPLLEFAEKQIPRSAHKRTPVFLYATAGVRRLPGPDSQWLLDKAWAILNNSSFLCSRDKVKIISGMEEAYYGWLALNYEKGLLGSSPSIQTFGSLDLGGSSLQVTFETEEPLQDTSSVSLKIGSFTHKLSAYSLPGYGLNDAFDKSVTHLVKRLSAASAMPINSGKIQVKHPCLQNGYREDYICSNCVALSRDASSSIGVLTTEKGKEGILVELLGEPQWEECSALAEIVVNFSNWSNLSSGVDCQTKPCALPNNLPYPRGQFYAMSGFYVVYKFFNLNAKATLKDVLQQGQLFCEKTWIDAKNSVAPQPFIEQYCFRAPYITSLLRDGLHIKDSQVVIGSGSITWTLGVALLESGQTLLSSFNIQGYRIFNQEMDPTVLFALLSLSVILLLFAVCCVNNWLPRALHKPYLPLSRQGSGTNPTLSMATPFRFKLWSPINLDRIKTPLSPTVASSEQHPFRPNQGFRRNDMQLAEFCGQQSSMSHGFTVTGIGQMAFTSGMWKALRAQTTLQSRRTLSREDLTNV